MHGTQQRAAYRRRRLRALRASVGLWAALALAVAVPAVAQSGTGTDALEADATGEVIGVRSSAEEPAPEDGSTDLVTSGQGELTIHADRTTVRFRQRVTFSGRRRPARKDSRVTLKYKRPGGTLEAVAKTRTDADGRYEVATRPKRNGIFLVTSPRRSGEALRSRREEVEVRAAFDLAARRHQLRVRGVKVRGTLRPRSKDRTVTLERQTGKGWLRVARTRTDRAGEFKAVWEAPNLGGYRLRARFSGDEANLSTREPLPRRVFVYRADEASYYGPGFFGNKTACGQTLRRDTVGVAHKRIRCGSKVRFHYQGRTRRIPVIDRGPFIKGRRWDLTEAARKKLGFPKGVDELWANR